MIDRLTQLKRISVPKSSDEAVSAALQAGLAAFDAAETDQAVKKSRQADQGSDRRRRLKGWGPLSLWRPLMHLPRIPPPVAASLVLLPAAALLAYEINQRYPLAGSDPVETAETRVRQTPAKPSPQSAPQAERMALQPMAGQAAPVAVPAHQVGGLRTKAMQPPDDHVMPIPESSADSFASFDTNPVKSVGTDPVSTFSVDVDTASYAFLRRMLNTGALPPPEAVRVEEMINYFDYDYPLPTDRSAPFSTNIALYPTPWNPDTKLMHIGLKAYDVAPETRPASNLVFLIDVSGSMDSPDKLPLLKNALRMLLDELEPEDTVAIVTYAGEAGTVLKPTAVAKKSKILKALDTLKPGGSTAGAAGLEEAYRLAESASREGSVNRVILATDGDFNVGVSDPIALESMIEDRRDSGVFLSVLGFGQGNYRDDIMQALSQAGNGVAAYIDTLGEARKVLVEEASAALFTVAKDVKIQVEFNPATIAEYRLIGYETRALNREDFNDDRVDAGDIGSGHAVTALYEVTPVGSPARLFDDLRYDPAAGSAGDVGEYAFLKLRYKLPDADTSTRITVPITTEMERGSIDELPDDYRFAASVAAFGQKLRGTRFVDGYDYSEIVDLANDARGADPFGYRTEFVGLVRLADSLDR